MAAFHFHPITFETLSLSLSLYLYLYLCLYHTHSHTNTINTHTFVGVRRENRPAFRGLAKSFFLEGLINKVDNFRRRIGKKREYSMSQMVRKKIQGGEKKLVHFNAYHDATTPMAEFLKFRRMVEEDDSIAVDYKTCLLDMLSMEERNESHKKRREKDEDDDVSENDNDICGEEDKDLQYEIFLKKLKEHEKSYVLQYENMVIKYEEDDSSSSSSSDEECDPEPRKKLRNAMKPNVEPFVIDNQCKDDLISHSTKEEIKNLNCRNSRHRDTIVIEEDVKLPTNRIVTDPEYIPCLSNYRVVDGHCAFTHGADTVVYGRNDEKKNNSDKEQDDEWSSDVEILDSTSFNEKVNKDSNPGDLRAHIEYRKQVIDVLRKPYDREEYKKLRMEIKLRKQGERHRELRHGREGPCSVDKDGKSYLDYHPDLKRQFLELKGDNPKRLNLLRGFFFWLQSLAQRGSFRPWSDEECLAIKPGSR